MTVIQGAPQIAELREQQEKRDSGSMKRLSMRVETKHVGCDLIIAAAVLPRPYAFRNSVHKPERLTTSDSAPQT